MGLVKHFLGALDALSEMLELLAQLSQPFLVDVGFVPRVRPSDALTQLFIPGGYQHHRHQHRERTNKDVSVHNTVHAERWALERGVRVSYTIRTPVSKQSSRDAGVMAVWGCRKRWVRQMHASRNISRQHDATYRLDEPALEKESVERTLDSESPRHKPCRRPPE